MFQKRHYKMYRAINLIENMIIPSRTRQTRPIQLIINLMQKVAKNDLASYAAAAACIPDKALSPNSDRHLPPPLNRVVCAADQAECRTNHAAKKYQTKQEGKKRITGSSMQKLCAVLHNSAFFCCFSIHANTEIVWRVCISSRKKGEVVIF